MKKCLKIIEPIAEESKIGCVLMSPDRKNDLASSLYTKTSASQYERLCDIDVSGLEQNRLSHNKPVYKKLKEQLARSEDDWFETGLVWKENKANLCANKLGSLSRLNSLSKRLDQKPDTLKEYDKVMKDQFANNIIERVSETENPKSKEFLHSHRAVVVNAESTNLSVVYDASDRSESGYSLNACVEKGPSLQNKPWDILIRTRFYPRILGANIKKDFLQMHIEEKKRESLKFHWVENLANNIIQLYRFTRLVFEILQSLFILEGTLNAHVENYRHLHLQLTEKIRDGTFVDNLVTGGEQICKVEITKSDSIELFERGVFKLHKRQSNTQPERPMTNDHSAQSELNYAKKHLGTKPNETKILDLACDKHRDTFRICISIYI